MTHLTFGEKITFGAQLRIGASISVFDNAGRMLLMLREDTGTWGVPGGGMNAGESIMECALRECFEETGLNASIKNLVGLYSNRDILVDYGNSCFQIVAAHFSGEFIGGSLLPSAESTMLRWCTYDDVQALKLFEFHSVRINDSWKRENTVHLRE